MKRFLIKTFLLLLPVVIVAVSMELMLRNIPNDSIYKKNYLDNHSKEIQILILGSSQAYFGINPDYFPQNTFNACHVSQSLDWDYEILKKYQNNFNNLKIIIIPIAYHTLWGKLEYSVESWRIKNYAIYYGIKTKSLTNNSEILNGKLGVNIDRINNYYIKKNSEINYLKRGWGTGFDAEKSADELEVSGKYRAIGHLSDIHSKEKIKVFRENLEILNSFAEFCNRNDVKLLLITTPVYHSYRDNLNEEQLNTMINTMNDFAAKHNNCIYLNWHENPDFIAEDYHDADHLSGKGAKKLSEKLVQYIDSLEIFKYIYSK